MDEELFNLIETFKKDERLFSYDEPATKQAVVLPILKALGWNPFDVNEVWPEYKVGDKRVDYALRHKGKNKVFIEVKKVGEDLEKHQEQLLNYSFQEGVKLAVLTNGISWWFYLPLREGSWEQRKFYTVEIYEQDTRDIVKRFEDFLSKNNVILDKAVENAESLYESKQRRQIIKETLPKAWNKLITEPAELLVNLLAETTEKLCGYKPEDNIVINFLREISQRKIGKKGQKENSFSQQTSFVSPLPTTTISKVHSLKQDYTGRSIVSFTFKGVRYEVRVWKEMLIKIAELMFSMHRQQFHKVFDLKGRKKCIFQGTQVN